MERDFPLNLRLATLQTLKFYAFSRRRLFALVEAVPYNVPANRESPLDTTTHEFSVEPVIARAWTLPSALYTSADVWMMEKEKIFSRTWQVVGHAHQVAGPGDYFTTDLTGEPLLLARGLDGKTAGLLQRLPASRRASG